MSDNRIQPAESVNGDHTSWLPCGLDVKCNGSCGAALPSSCGCSCEGASGYSCGCSCRCGCANPEDQTENQNVENSDSTLNTDVMANETTTPEKGIWEKLKEKAKSLGSNIKATCLDTWQICKLIASDKALLIGSVVFIVLIAIVLAMIIF